MMHQPISESLTLIVAITLALASPVQADEKTQLEVINNPFAKKSWHRPVTIRPRVEKPEPPQAPPLEFVCFGRFIDDTGRSMVFLQKGARGPVFLVTTGDIVDGVYRVEGIQNNMVNLRYLPLGLMQTIRMNGDVS